jgi:hypothetical protein
MTRPLVVVGSELSEDLSGTAGSDEMLGLDDRSDYLDGSARDDLAGFVQEIIDRDGWVDLNNVAITGPNAVSLAENQIAAIDVSAMDDTGSEGTCLSCSLSNAALKLSPPVSFPEGQDYGRHYRH